MRKVLNYLKENVAFGKVTRTTLVVLLILVFNLSNAQETYQDKKFGQDVTWEFTQNEVIVTTNGVVNVAKIKSLGNQGKLTVYQTTEPFMGAKTKWEIVHKSKNKYTMIMTSVDDFSGEVNKGILVVKKL